MIAPSVLIVIDSPESTLRTFEIGATGRPEPIRGVTRPVATRCTPSIAASASSRRRYPLREGCWWWVLRAIGLRPQDQGGEGVRDRDRLRAGRAPGLAVRR